MYAHEGFKRYIERIAFSGKYGGVGDHRIDPAILVDGLFYEAFDVCLFADICRNSNRITARGRHFGGHPVEIGRRPFDVSDGIVAAPQVRQHQFCAFSRITECRRTSHTARSPDTRDDDDLSF